MNKIEKVTEPEEDQDLKKPSLPHRCTSAGTKNYFGSALQDIRKKRPNESMREYCKRYSMDIAYYSRLEGGKVPPPKSLVKILIALEINSPIVRKELEMLASLSRGEIPTGIMVKQSGIYGIPLIFKWLDSMDIEQMQAFIDHLRVKMGLKTAPKEESKDKES